MEFKRPSTLVSHECSVESLAVVFRGTGQRPVFSDSPARGRCFPTHRPEAGVFRLTGQRPVFSDSPARGRCHERTAKSHHFNRASHEPKASAMPKAVVLLSGGLDSTTA